MAHREIAVNPVIGSFGRENEFYAALVFSHPKHVEQLPYLLRCITEVLGEPELLGFPIGCVRLSDAISSGEGYRQKIRTWCRNALMGVVVLDGLRPNVTYELGVLDGLDLPILLVATDSARVSVKAFYDSDFERIQSLVEISERQWRHLGEPPLDVARHLSDVAGAHYVVVPPPHIDENGCKEKLRRELHKMRNLLLKSPRLQGKVSHLQAEYSRAISGRDFARGLALTEELLLIDEGNCNYHRQKGICLGELDRLEASLAAFDRGLQVHKNCAQILVNRSVTYELLGKMEEALSDASMAASLSNDDVWSHERHAFVLAKVGKGEAARAEAARILALDPANEAAWRLLVGDDLDNGKLEDALRTAEKFLAATSNKAAAHEVHGIVLYEGRKLKEAEQALVQSCKLEPNNHGAHMQLGVIRSELADLEGSLNAFEQATKCTASKDEVGHAWFHIAMTYEQGNRHANAIDAYEKAKELGQQPAACHNSIAMIHLRQGNFEEALFASKHATTLEPEDLDYRSTYGLALAMCGQCNKAVALVEPILKRSPRCEALIEGAIIFAQCGHTDRAQALIARARAMPDYADSVEPYRTLLERVGL